MPRELRPLDELLNYAYELKEAQANLDQLKSKAGTSLKLAREAKGVSQSYLAAAMDVDKSYLSQVENGAKTPTTDRLTEAYVIISKFNEGGSVGYTNKAEDHIKKARSKEKKSKKGGR